MFKKKFALYGAALAMTFSSASFADVAPNLSDYERTSGISGSFSSVGSDTLANLMTLWAEEFKREYPNVSIQIQAAGSSTAPPALTEGTSNVGPMSRKMKDSEIKEFENKYGYKPTAIPVAIDALAIYVHKDNPIKGMTIAQVDAVFSATRKCGYSEDVTDWSQLGVEGLGSIQLYGRNSVSGTYGYFKDHALCKGDYKNSVNEQPGSASVVQGVTKSTNGLGYSGIGYKTSGVKLVPLAKEAGQPFVEANAENAADGSFPLSRFLWVYVNKVPNKPMSPIDREFMKMILSKVGQKVVVKDGYVPLPAKTVTKYMERLK